MKTSICFGCMEKIDNEGVCPKCGFDPAKYVPELHRLAPGTLLRERYAVGKVLGEGGFGITYIGKDTVLNRKVAVKEFYMSGYVNRNVTVSTTVTPNSGSYGETFERNREKFLDEARVLARFDDEDGIVEIRDYFRENNTAYIVMNYLDGETLRSFIDREERIPAYRAFEILRPVMRSLGNVHDHNIIHRDISPDNIMLTSNGKVKLLDFGAAREVSASDIKSLSIILKPGYAPEEQYRSKGKQGPWTDIYAICATLYRCITGTVPEESMNRLFEDRLPSPADLGCDCSKAISGVIMKGLSVRYTDRYQSVAELLDAVDTARLHADEPKVEPEAEPDENKTVFVGEESTVFAAPEVTKEPEATVSADTTELAEDTDCTVLAGTIEPAEDSDPTVFADTIEAVEDADRTVFADTIETAGDSDRTVFADTIETAEDADRTVFADIIETAEDTDRTVFADTGEFAASKAPSERTGEYSIEETKFPPISQNTPKTEAEQEDTKSTAKNTNRIYIGVTLTVVAIIAFVCIYSIVTSPSKKYNEAIEFMNNENYSEAISVFESLDGYKDSVKKISECETAITAMEIDGKYNDALSLMDSGEYTEAALLFGKLGDYKDSREKSMSLWADIAERETISAGTWHSVGLKKDGTAVAVSDKYYDKGRCNVSKWTDIIAVSAGSSNTVGLKEDGTVVAVGLNSYGQCDVNEWTDILVVSAGNGYTVGLKKDGTVVAAGLNDDGRCNVDQWTDIVAISAGTFHTVGLKKDGTVVAAGLNSYGQCNVGEWTDIIAVSAKGHHTVGLKKDGTVVAVGDNGVGQCDVGEWTDIVAVSAGHFHTVGLKKDGTVVAVGFDSRGRCNVSDWTDIVAISAGTDNTIGLKKDGTVVARWSVVDDGKNDVDDWTDIKIP